MIDGKRGEYYTSLWKNKHCNLDISSSPSPAHVDSCTPGLKNVLEAQVKSLSEVSLSNPAHWEILLTVLMFQLRLRYEIYYNSASSVWVECCLTITHHPPPCVTRSYGSGTGLSASSWERHWLRETRLDGLSLFWWHRFVQLYCGFWVGVFFTFCQFLSRWAYARKVPVQCSRDRLNLSRI